MKVLTSSLKQVFRLLAALLIAYILIRVLFLIFNYSIFKDMVGGDVFRALFYGLRYDVSAILYINVPFFLLLLLPFKFKLASGYQSVIRALFVVANLAAFTIAFSDFAFFQFNLKRIDVEVLGLFGTIEILIWDLVRDFYLIFILFFAWIWGFIKLSKKLFRIRPQENFRRWIELPILIILLPVFVIGMRGGITNKRPIRVVDASNYVPVKFTPLVTNSVFTALNSLDGRILDRRSFFQESELVKKYDVRRSNEGTQDEKKQNVVIIVLEGFSKQFTGQNTSETSYTPFLDELIDSGLFCSNAHANGRRSSQGLVAIASSIPALMDEPFMYSKYVNNKIHGLGSILQEHGYETYFFNASNKDKVGWQSFLMSAGFENNVDKFDYPNQDHDDGSWGIYDHYFYQFFVDEMSKAQRPFGSIFFSISSHHPFKIPPEYQEQFSKYSEFYNSLEYADYSLRLFFEKAKETDWYENTIFVISADHTYGANWNDGNSVTNKYKTRKGLYEIPILFYDPGNPNLRGKVEFAVQQTDIMPSLVDHLNLKTDFISFGQSVFSEPDQPRIAYQYLNGVYQIEDQEYFLMHDGDKAIALYNFIEDELLVNNILDSKPEIAQNLERTLNAIIQQHNNRLIDNDLINN